MRTTSQAVGVGEATGARPATRRSPREHRRGRRRPLVPARGGGNRAWRRPATSADHAARVPRAFVRYCNASARGMTLRTHLASTEVIHGRASPQPCGQRVRTVLYACMKCVAQGVTRRRIRTNECLGRALEVALAAHASTEALACGGGVLSSRTCNHPLGVVGGSSMSGVACMHRVRCSGRHPQADPRQ